MIAANREPVRAAAKRWLPGVGLPAAAVLAVVLAVVSAHIPAHSGDRTLDGLGYALIAVASLSLGASRRWPRLAALVVTTILCVFIARDYPNGPVWLTGLVALAVLSWRTNRRTAVAGAVVMLAALTATAMTTGQLPILVSGLYLGWTAAAVFLGEALRSRRSYLSGLADRAQLAERSRVDEAARRVVEERLRIARDLHDSVAHAMAVINVQAGAAVHVLASQPEAAAPALSAIQRASAEVLDELGSMLAVLRDGGEQAERAPTPGLGDMGRLVDSVGSSGLAVELLMTGSTRSTPPALGTAAYRVVQESLTNVLRHSQARHAQVCLTGAGRAGALCVEIHDPGPAKAHHTKGTGVGIRGMRERVAATGGQFAAEPTPDGGFVVRAAWGHER